MTWRGRIPASAWRIGGWIIAGLVTSVLFLSAAVLVAGNTATGRHWLENMTARLTSGQVQITGLGGRFPSELEAAQLRLYDSKGVWLTADRIQLHWSPLALLRHRIVVDTVHVSHLDMERMPAARPERPSRVRENRLPRIVIRAAHVDVFELGPLLAGQRTQLTMEGRARLISLEDARAHVLATRVGGQGRYDVRLDFDPRRMDATVSLEEPAFGPLQNLIHLPQLGAVAVKGTLTGPRQAERLDLQVHAGELQGEAHGTVDLTHRAASLDYRVQSGAVSPRPDLAWQRIDVAGSAHGPWTAPLASGQAHVEQLRLPSGVALQQANGKLSGAAGGLQAHVQVDGLVIPGPRPQVLAQEPAVFDATMRLDDPRRPLELTAHHPLISLQASALTAGIPEAKLHANLTSLAPLAGLAGQTADGPGTIDAKIERRGTDTHVTLTADADVSGEGSPDWGQLLGRGSHLQLDGLLTDRKLTLTNAHLTGQAAALTLSGTGTRASAGGPLQSLEGSGQLTLANLAAVSPLLAGRLTADTQLSGPLRALRAEVQASSSLSVRGSAPSDIEARLNVRGLPAAPEGTIEAHGSLDGAPLTVNAELDREPGGVFHITVHRTDWKSAHAQGDLRTTARLARAHGSMDLRIDRLEDLQRLAGTPLQGRVAGQVSLMSFGARTQAQLRVIAQDAVIAGFHGTGELNAHGSVDALPVQLALQMPDLHGAPAQLNASGQLRMRQQALELLSAELRYHDEPVTLAAPAELRFGQGLTVSELRLTARRAHLNLGGRLTPALDLHAALQGVDAELVNSFVPNFLAQGTASADLQLHGQLPSPQGSAHFELTGVRLAQAYARTLPPLQAHGSAELRGGGAAQLDGTVSAGTTLQLALHGQMPLQGIRLQETAPSAALVPPAQGVLDLTLSGKGDLTLANAVLDAYGQHATGPLTVDAHITGTAAAPEIDGKIELTHGDFRDYGQGVHLSHINALLTGRNGTLEIQRFTARAATGEIEVTGSLGVLQPLVPLQLHLKARNAQPLASDILTANVDGDLDLKGALQQSVTLSGSILVHRADIGIPNTLPTNVAVLDVRRPGQAPPHEVRRPLAIALDVHLDAPRQILVTGRGVDAELGGRVHILGTRSSPKVNGGFDLIRGNLSLAGSSLTFTEGRVSFTGAGLTGRLDPQLDLTAQSAVGDSTATLRVTGPADAPRFELTSSPQDLPKDEILSRLLFGESMTTLSASQVVTMGSALSALTGLGSGLNPLEMVQRTLGLDRLAVSTTTLGTAPTAPNANTGATVEAGRYVTNNVFVAARQTTTGVTQLVVDIDISRGLKVRTKVGNGSSTVQGVTPENDPGSSVGVAYQFEY